MFRHGVVTVGDTATLLASMDVEAKYGRVLLRNKGAGTIDLGDSSVTDGTGYEFDTGSELEVELPPGEDLYGISASAASNDISVLVSPVIRTTAGHRHAK